MNQEQSKAGGVATDRRTAEANEYINDLRGRKATDYTPGDVRSIMLAIAAERDSFAKALEVASIIQTETVAQNDALRERVAKLEAALRSALPAIRWAMTDTMDDPESHGFQGVLDEARAALAEGKADSNA